MQFDSPSDDNPIQFPLPEFEPISRSGVGPGVVSIVKPDGPAIIKVNATSNIGLETENAKGESRRVLFRRSDLYDPYDGTIVIDIPERVIGEGKLPFNTKRIHINTDANDFHRPDTEWKITVLPLLAANELKSAPFVMKGNTDDVFIVRGVKLNKAHAILGPLVDVYCRNIYPKLETPFRFLSKRKSLDECKLILSSVTNEFLVIGITQSSHYNDWAVVLEYDKAYPRKLEDGTIDSSC